VLCRIGGISGLCRHNEVKIRSGREKSEANGIKRRRGALGTERTLGKYSYNPRVAASKNTKTKFAKGKQMGEGERGNRVKDKGYRTKRDGESAMGQIDQGRKFQGGVVCKE